MLTSLMEILKWFLKNYYWINIVLAFLVIFFERKNPTTTLLWVMVLFFLPGIGFLGYLFLGQDLRKKKMFDLKDSVAFKYQQIADVQKNKYIEKDYGQLKEMYLNCGDVINLNLNSCNSVLTADNKVQLYFEGEEKFEHLLEDIKNAKEYIYMEYYIFKTDKIGKKVMEALISMAYKGVEVKLLVDAVGGRFLEKKYLEKLEQAGGQWALFFPATFQIINFRLNYRNHRKLVIIDKDISYVGGFNVGDEYLGRNKKIGEWNDTHVRIKGSGAKGLLWRFYLDWKFAYGDAVPMPELEEYSGRGGSGSGIQIVSSGPDSKWANVKSGYLKMIADAKKRIYIKTPYFIPDSSIIEALKIAALSGIDVKVMIPANPDHPFVYWASISYIGELLGTGARFYEYTKGFLHSKSIIIDEYVSSVGTANMDNRSFFLNFEVNAFIYDKEINEKLASKFNEDLLDCKEIDQHRYEKLGRINKIKESFSRLLSPLL